MSIFTHSREKQKMSDNSETLVRPTLSKSGEASYSAFDGNHQVVEGGVLKGQSTMYTSAMPEGVTTESMNQHMEFNRGFVKGTQLRFAEVGAELLKRDATIQNVTIAIPMGRDKVTHTMDREGKIVSGYSMYGTSGHGGEAKKIADYVSQLVSQHLG